MTGNEQQLRTSLDSTQSLSSLKLNRANMESTQSLSSVKPHRAPSSEKPEKSGFDSIRSKIKVVAALGSMAKDKSKSGSMQDRFTESYKYKRTKDEAMRLMAKYGIEGRDCIDREGFWRLLKEIDPDGRDPLPCNFEWAWKNGKKGTEEFLDSQDISAIIPKYQNYVNTKPHIGKIIQDCDTNNDGNIDQNEMFQLLERVSGQPVDSDDVLFVMEERKKILKHTSGSGKLGSSPDVLLKAIASWWQKKGFDPAAFQQWKLSQRRPLPAMKPVKGDVWEDITRLFACCTAPVPINFQPNPHY